MDPLFGYGSSFSVFGPGSFFGCCYSHRLTHLSLLYFFSSIYEVQRQRHAKKQQPPMLVALLMAEPLLFLYATNTGKDLSDEQVSAMKEAFTLFDTDGDGKIAQSELGILIRSLGGNPTQAQLKSIIAEEKLTSPFDFNRFTDLMAKHLKPEPFDRQLRDAFKVINKDGNGYVVVADLKYILTSIGEKLEPAEFDEWIREIDVGSDGKIKYIPTSIG